MELNHGSMSDVGPRGRKRAWSPEAEHDSNMPVDEPVLPFGQARSAPHLVSDFGVPSKRSRVSKPDSTAEVGKHDFCTRANLVELPPEILQTIFVAVDPVSLGRIMMVNRLFRSLLDPARPLPGRPLSSHPQRLLLRKQNLIWTLSRRKFFPGFPKPMDDMNELDMWRFALGRTCHYCCKYVPLSRAQLPSDPWRSGPGLDGVRAIWPFKIRACGNCLQTKVLKDVEILVSTYSALRPGLPFTFVTPDMHYVSLSAIRERTPPPTLELFKCYFKPQFDELRSKFISAETMGPGALDEWKKGLEAAGQKSNADAARFEQFELQRGFYDLFHTGYTKIVPAPPTSRTLSPAAQEEMAGRSTQHSNVESHASTPTPASRQGSSSVSDPMTHVSKPATQLAGSSHHSRHRNERSFQEAMEKKAERRKEIERRCLALSPPIMPSTLTYMAAFRAAIVISLPLDERAWEILKPRLLAQRADAEQSELKTKLDDPALQDEQRQSLIAEREVAQENADNMWLELKVPARDKLKRVAEDFVHQTWSNGQAVTKATASKFAAEVLCHVRQRFDEVIAQEDRMLALKGTAFPQDRESLDCRKLRLEDMKWVFEEFVKPHAQRFGKELFLCHVCDLNQKLFSFEAVVQHFASKHTTALSHGTSIVYWKADWPLEPPFDPQPNVLWALGGSGSGLVFASRTSTRSLPSLPGVPPSVHSEHSSGSRRHLERTKQPHLTSGSHVSASSQFGPISTIQQLYTSGPAHDSGYSGQRPTSGATSGSPWGRPPPSLSGTLPSLESQWVRSDLAQSSTYAASVPGSKSFGPGQAWSTHSSTIGHARKAWKEGPSDPPQSTIHNMPASAAYQGSPVRTPLGNPKTQPQSSSSSVISLRREMGSVHATSQSHLRRGDTDTDRDSVRTAAEDFLDSFDPNAIDTASVAAESSISNQPRQSSRPLSRHELGLDHRDGPSTHAGIHPSYGPSVYPTSLPIRQTTWQSPAIHAETLHYRDPPLTDHPRRSEQEPFIDHWIEPPELEGIHRRDLYSPSTANIPLVASFHGRSAYESHYVYDDQGRCYEQLRDVSPAPRTERHDNNRPLPMSREPPLPSGWRYVDDMPGPSQHHGYHRDIDALSSHHVNYVRDVRYVSPEGNNHQYIYAERPSRDLQTRTGRFDNQEILYRPVSPGEWSTAHSPGVHHAEHSSRLGDR